MLVRALLCASAVSVPAAVFAACAALPAFDGSVDSEHRTFDNTGSSGALIYAGEKNVVETYAFPSGNARATFTVRGEVNGICSDSKGNVFIALAPKKLGENATGYVEKFAHGGTTPSATLELPERQIPVACSSDAATGDLAVTAQNGRNFTPVVAVYTGATGTPRVYTSRALGANPQVAYDGVGNLFATSGGNVGVELGAGQSVLKKVVLAQTLGGAAHVQWDGKYWAIESFDTTKHNREKLFERIFRVEIAGSAGKVAGESRFADWPASDPGQAWIEKDTILGTPRSSIEFWTYPAGGKPVKTIRSPHHAKAIAVSPGG